MCVTKVSLLWLLYLMKNNVAKDGVAKNESKEIYNENSEDFCGDDHKCALQNDIGI